MVLQRTSISLAIPTNWSNFFSHLASYPPRYRSWHESRWSRRRGRRRRHRGRREAGEEGTRSRRRGRGHRLGGAREEEDDEDDAVAREPKKRMLTVMTGVGGTNGWRGGASATDAGGWSYAFFLGGTSDGRAQHRPRGLEAWSHGVWILERESLW